MNRILRGLSPVVATVITVLGGSAAAQAIRTEVITVEPPEGWVLSVWQGGTVEVGEFTPPGQTGAGFIDLLGYSALPRTSNGPVNENDLLTLEQANAPAQCRRHALRRRPALPGWLGLVRICVGREGQAGDMAELEFAVTRLTDQAVYRVWRTHRAPYAELVSRTRLVGTEPDQMDVPAFEAIVAAWEPDMAADVDRREVCDLSAPTVCRAFSRPLPAEFKALFGPDGGYVAAVYATGLNTISREQFILVMGAPADSRGPSRVFAIFGPGELDWSDITAVNRVLRLVAYGQAADGGILAIVDPENRLSAEETTTLRAQLIAGARRLQKPDRPPSILTISVPAN